MWKILTIFGLYIVMNLDTGASQIHILLININCLCLCLSISVSFANHLD